MDGAVQSRSCADSLGKGSGAYIAGCFTPDQLITAFGAKAVLLVPLVILGPIISFLRSEWNALVDQFNNHDQYRIVITRDAAPSDVHTVRFDGIGPLRLSMTAADLGALGYTNQGNAYEGSNAACVRYAKSGSMLSVSVDSNTGHVLAIRNYGGDSQMHTEVGNIRQGSTLAEVLAAFSEPGYQIVEKLNGDFGQGSNGVIINGPGGAIGLGLGDPAADGTEGVNWVAGVGTAGNAPTAEETGC